MYHKMIEKWQITNESLQGTPFQSNKLEKDQTSSLETIFFRLAYELPL